MYLLWMLCCVANAALPCAAVALHAVDDVAAALYHVKTRSIAVGGCLALLPVHDFINHADPPNCLVNHQGLQG
jgi:hypothetical protein